MAELKDTVVAGNLRVTNNILTNMVQVKVIQAPTASNGTTYGIGENGEILVSNGTTVYWAKNNLSTTDVIETITFTQNTPTAVTKKTVVTGGNKTAIPNVTSAGTAASASYSAGVVTFTNGTAPSLGTAIQAYTSLTTGDSVTVTAGTKATLTKTEATVVTGITTS